MKQWKDHPLVLGLGEVMCYPAVLSKEEQIMKKLELCKGMIIDGHAPGLTGDDLKAYVEAGVMTEHECTSFEEAKEKLKKINVRDCGLWWSLIIYDQKHSTHPTFFNPQFML